MEEALESQSQRLGKEHQSLIGTLGQYKHMDAYRDDSAKLSLSTYV